MAENIINLLVIDDDDDDKYIILRACENSKHEYIVNFVKNGVELLDYLSHKNKYTDKNMFPRPDILLLDLNMPKMTGLEALEYMKAHSLMENIRVIVYTTSSNDNDLKKALELGADSFFTKSWDFKEIIAHMDEAGDLKVAENFLESSAIESTEEN